MALGQKVWPASRYDQLLCIAFRHCQISLSEWASGMRWCGVHGCAESSGGRVQVTQPQQLGTGSPSNTGSMQQAAAGCAPTEVGLSPPRSAGAIQSAPPRHLCCPRWLPQRRPAACGASCCACPLCLLQPLRPHCPPDGQQQSPEDSDRRARRRSAGTGSESAPRGTGWPACPGATPLQTEAAREVRRNQALQLQLGAVPEKCSQPPGHGRGWGRDML